jgi:hypothetical protein
MRAAPGHAPAKPARHSLCDCNKSSDLLHLGAFLIDLWSHHP